MQVKGEEEAQLQQQQKIEIKQVQAGRQARTLREVIIEIDNKNKNKRFLIVCHAFVDSPPMNH